MLGVVYLLNFCKKYSNVQDICDQISSTMNRMYTAKLNDDVIVTNTVRNVLRKHGSKFSWNPRETPMLLKNIQSWESAKNNNEQSNEQKAYSYDHINDNIQFQAAIQQWHTHTFTCKKDSMDIQVVDYANLLVYHMEQNHIYLHLNKLKILIMNLLMLNILLMK